MRCAWQELLSVIPVRMRREVDRLGSKSMQELRLRINAPPEMCVNGESLWLSGAVTQEELNFVVNTASRYSPWAASTIAKGFLSSEGGHRIGICGEIVCKEGRITGFREISSVCIRVARDFPGIAEGLKCSGSVLILGAPGWGKTTLLRDLIRQLSKTKTVCAIDERGELFPKGIDAGKRLDILSGCPKREGVEMALRTMCPDWIAVDEITADTDSKAMVQAVNCGVRFAATAHAASLEDFYRRDVYRELVEKQVFETVLLLRKDKSFHMERMTQCITNGSVRY